eukprot:545172-Alexandrium_andersonii.AAC.1
MVRPRVASLRSQDKRPELGLPVEGGACAELRLTALVSASRVQGRTSTASQFSVPPRLHQAPPAHRLP